MNLRTDRPHELHVYVWLAQARPNNRGDNNNNNFQEASRVIT